MSCGLRDVAELETLGRPAVLIASAAFVQAADEQASLLGAPNLALRYVEHPVQDRTDDEIREMARAVVDEALAAIS